MSDPIGSMGRQALSLLQLMNQMQQAKTAQRISQYQNLLASATPGETFQQLGASPEVLKAALGFVPQGTALVKPETSQHKMDVAAQKAIDQLPPDQLQAIALSTTIDRGTGLTGFHTGQEAVTSAKANETEAATNLAIAQGTQKSKIASAISSAHAQATSAQSVDQAITAGFDAWKASSPENKAAQGYRLLFGQAQGVAQQEQVSAQLKTEVTKIVLKNLADPRHPLDAVFRPLGMNAETGIAALSLGAGSLLDAHMQAIAQLQVIGAQTQAKLTDADIQAATDLAKKFGVTTSMALAQLQMIYQGKQPTTDFGKALQAGMGANIRAAIGTAIANGDPQAQLFKELGPIGVRMANQPEGLNAVSQLLRHQAAVVMLGQYGITRPDPGDSKATARYNQYVDQMAKTLGGFGVSGLWMWKDVSADIPRLTQPTMQPIGGTPAPDTAQVTGPGGTAISPQQQRAVDLFNRANMPLQP